jgi:tetratricopeptide (TPR) repeat protein
VTLQQLTAVVWYLQGRFREVVRLGQRIEKQAALGGPRERQYAHFVIAWGFMGQGRVTEAIEHYEQAVKEAQLDGDKVDLALAYQNLGQQEYLGGRFASAREHLALALSLFHDSASDLRAASTLHSLCRVWVADGEHERARQRLLQLLDQEIDSQVRWAAEAQHILGTIHTLRAEWEAAVASFEHALQGRKHAAHLPGSIEEIVALGFVDQCRGRWGQAMDRYAEAVAVAEQMDAGPHRVLALRHRGRLRVRVGDRVQAEADIGAVLALAETMPETLEYAPTLLAAAELRAEVGDLDGALDLASRSLEEARPLDQIVEAHIGLGRVSLARRDVPSAVAHSSRAVGQATLLGSPRLISLAHLVFAKSMAEQDAERAHDAFKIALLEADKAQAPYERALALQAYSAFLRRPETELGSAVSMQDEARALMQAMRGTLTRA